MSYTLTVTALTSNNSYTLTATSLDPAPVMISLLLPFTQYQ